MKSLHLLILFAGNCLYLFGQNIGIGTNAPHASALLEIKANNKGLLIPRTSTVSRTGIIDPAKGLLLYDTTVGSFFFYNGNAWSNLSTTSPGSGWALSGNAGTNPSVNFVGTSDAQPLVLKVNNTMAGILDFDATKANTAIGYSTLNNNTGGYNNTASGYKSLNNNTTGTSNAAHGMFSLYQNQTGHQNTANGFAALYANIEGSYNTATGAGALNNSAGNFNTANGAYALYLNKLGEFNTATGGYALYSNLGSSSTANGYKALYSNTTGRFNTASGVTALFSNTTGEGNSALGLESLYLNTLGWYNTAIGMDALLSNTGGSGNTAVGAMALESNSEWRFDDNLLFYAEDNTAVGFRALYSNTSGNSNTALGTSALSDNLSGDFNTGLGYDASTKEYLKFATAIGAKAVIACNNCLALGGSTVESRTKVGINFEAPSTDLHIRQQSDVSGNNTRGIRLQRSGDTFWRMYVDGLNTLTFEYNDGGGGHFGWINTNGSFVDGSDSRIKRDIQSTEKLLQKLLMLHPQKYRFIHEDENNHYTYGFVAQDLQKIFPEFVHEREDGRLGISYGSFGVVAIKAIQEQQTIIEEQEQRIENLRKEILRLQTMPADIDMLKALLTKAIQEQQAIIDLQNKKMMAMQADIDMLKAALPGKQ
jgi:trimeric autotransporter adhesin